MFEGKTCNCFCRVGSSVHQSGQSMDLTAAKPNLNRVAGIQLVISKRSDQTTLSGRSFMTTQSLLRGYRTRQIQGAYVVPWWKGGHGRWTMPTVTQSRSCCEIIEPPIPISNDRRCRLLHRPSGSSTGSSPHIQGEKRLRDCFSTEKCTGARCRKITARLPLTKVRRTGRSTLFSKL